ncbi:phage tail tape measure protein [Clostridiaceae bacterium]|nr:phage tail tape measure protein [Clostridiaceae bacterium]
MATRTISTRLAVEGEAQYKQAVASCNAELATLKSNLALAESAFQGNANSMEALTAKGSALEALYSKQKEKVSELENALKNCQRAQQEYADRAAAAQDNITRCEQALAALGDAAGDTSEEQKALTAELDRWNAELAEAEAGQAAAGRGVQSWQKQLNYAKVDLNGLSDELGRNSQYLAEAGQSADGCARSIDEYGKEVKGAGEASEDFGSKSKNAIDQLASALAAAGIAKAAKEIADTLLECAQAAEGFESSVAKVSTIADTSKVSMADLSAQILTLSGETGKSASEIAESVYSAISASVDTAAAVDFVRQSTQLATGGFTEAQTAVDVLTTALNAYHLSVSETEKVSDVLVTTQKLGKTTVDELAQSVGKVIPLAAAYSMNIENLGTSYAELTKNGIATAEAGTYIKSMLTELGDSGSAVAGILRDQTGKSFAELMAGGASLGDVIAELSQGAGGSKDAFAELWSSTEAGVGALSLLGSGADAFNTTLAAMENSAGATADAYGKMADTTEFAHQRMTTALDNLKIAIGSELNPALQALYEFGGNVFTWATDFVTDHPAVVQSLAALTAGILALTGTVATVQAITAAFAALKMALAMASPATLLVAGVAAAGAALATFGSFVTSADEEVKAFTESLSSNKQAYEEFTASMQSQQANTAATAASLLELLGAEERSAAQKEIIAQMVDELNEAVPNLGLSYDAAADSINLSADAIERLVEKAAEQEEYEAQVARLNELYVERQEIAMQLTEAEDALNNSQGTGVLHVNALTNNVRDLTDAQEENAAAIAELEAAVGDYNAQQAESATQTEEMTARVESVIAEMEGLQKSYEDAQQKAYESISQQMGLFQQMDGEAKTSIDSLIASLESQVTYMETYAQNIQKAMEMGVDEGLVRKLSDGSEESAQILDAIVRGGEDDIKALNEKFAQVEEGKKNFSDTVAQMETDFSEKMDTLVKDLEDAIQEMDVKDEARKIGLNNIEGLISGTGEKRKALIDQYAEMGRAALAAYKREVAQASPSKKFREVGRYDVEGIILGAEDEKRNLETTYQELARTALESAERFLTSPVAQPVTTEILDRQAEAFAAAAAVQQPPPIVMNFTLNGVTVREEADIDRIAQALYFMAADAARSRGGHL